MAEGSLEAEWDRTASLMALIANIHRDPKKGRTFKPADFHPYARKSRGAALPKVKMRELKGKLMEVMGIRPERTKV